MFFFFFFCWNAFTPLCPHGEVFIYFSNKTKKSGHPLEDSSARTLCDIKDASQLGAQVRSVQT